VRSNTRKATCRDYVGQIDLFLVYCRDTDDVYAIPIEEGIRGEGRLRVAPPTNGQRRRIRWAADHVLRPPAARLDSLAPPE
jgi:hypothetical protein